MRHAAALILLLLSQNRAWAAAQLPDLSGVWHAPFTIEQSTKDEEVRIVQKGKDIQATKITGDPAVPAGKMNFRARYTGMHFPAEQLCALGYSHAFFWEAVSVAIIDKDHFKVVGGCSGGAIWSRESTAVS